MKKKDVVERILSYHPELPDYHGCDDYKSGFEGEECTGIAVALVPTVDVIRRAAACGCNLLITHEPIYYQSPDYPRWFAEGQNHVAEQKQRMIEDARLTIWRDHDHMHAQQPDAIFSGVLSCLGWERYLVKEVALPEMSYLLELPVQNAIDLAAFLTKAIDLNGIRIIGNPEAKIQRLALVAHLYPGAFGETKEMPTGYTDYSVEVIRMMEDLNVQALIPGEIIEWTVLSYIRDAAFLGEDKVCFNIGHFNWEELGMKAFAGTIRNLVGDGLPVHYLATGDIATYYVPDADDT